MKNRTKTSQDVSSVSPVRSVVFAFIAMCFMAPGYIIYKVTEKYWVVLSALVAICLTLWLLPQVSTLTCVAATVTSIIILASFEAAIEN